MCWYAPSSTLHPWADLKVRVYMLRSLMGGAYYFYVYTHAAADDLVLTSSKVILEYKSTEESADWIKYDTQGSPWGGRRMPPGGDASRKALRLNQKK